MIAPVFITSALISQLFLGFFSASTGFDSVGRRFLFTLTNQSPYRFALINSDQWYGNLDAPLNFLEAGNTTHMGVLQIRGFKTPIAATGVTYSLCFRVDDKSGKDTGSRLNVYLQVGFNANNYYGWTFRDAGNCDAARSWYGSTGFNRGKVGCVDGVLNKGGTHSLSASCKNMTIEMFTDNQSFSTPTLTIKHGAFLLKDAITANVTENERHT
ncbi:unnamed protein product [Adineta steineri]|uniref:Uncharacterized protein n=1 Tax=Adineta steineri TaxID=433720 RepID=A0A814VQN7_9BILA|nr:unnamed protein product [Adineta steineri]CAF1223689.1 unnamed protein product [Adineta steineri]